MGNFWKIWSEALEDGYLEATTGTKEIHKKITVRWNITILEMAPTKQTWQSLSTKYSICGNATKACEVNRKRSGDKAIIEFIVVFGCCLKNFYISKADGEVRFLSVVHIR